MTNIAVVMSYDSELDPGCFKKLYRLEKIE